MVRLSFIMSTKSLEPKRVLPSGKIKSKKTSKKAIKVVKTKLRSIKDSSLVLVSSLGIEFDDKDIECLYYIKLHNSFDALNCNTPYLLRNNKTNINIIIQNLFTGKGVMTNCLSLSDSTSEGQRPGSHSKMIYIEFDDMIIWIMHSCPKWPSIDFDPSVPSTYTINGGLKHNAQHFNIIKFKKNPLEIGQTNKFRKIIFTHIINMNSKSYKYYIDNLSGDVKTMFDKIKSDHEFNIIYQQLTEKIFLISKPTTSSIFKQIDIYDYIVDLYGDIKVFDHKDRQTPNKNNPCYNCDLDPALRSSCIHRGSLLNTSHIKMMNKMENVDCDIKRTKNHTKFGITTNNKYIFMGDLNRAYSQNYRGGGFIIHLNENAWNLFNTSLK